MVFDGLQAAWSALDGNLVALFLGQRRERWRSLYLQSRECLRSYEELLSGRPLDVTVERIGAEHAGE